MKCSDTVYNGSPWEWRNLGVAAFGVAAPGNGGPGSSGPWEWRTQTNETTRYPFSIVSFCIVVCACIHDSGVNYLRKQLSASQIYISIHEL